MALDIKINQEFASQTVSHNNVAAKKISEHTQDELLQLGIIARSSNNPILMRCFIDLPIMDELVKAKTEADIKQVKDNTLTKTDGAIPPIKTDTPVKP